MSWTAVLRKTVAGYRAFFIKQLACIQLDWYAGKWLTFDGCSAVYAKQAESLYKLLDNRQTYFCSWEKSVTLIFLKIEQDQRIDPFQSDIFMLELQKSAKDKAKDQYRF